MQNGLCGLSLRSKAEVNTERVMNGSCVAVHCSEPALLARLGTGRKWRAELEKEGTFTR